MKTKTLLNEWRLFLSESVLSEVSIKRFSEQHPQFDTSNFTSQMKGNTDYLDIISNSISAGQNHGPDDYIQQFEFYKNSIEPNRNSQDFLTIQTPGDEPVSLSGKVDQGSCTATYDDIQQFQQARLYVLGKGSKNKINDAYQRVIDEAKEEDFEKVAENDNWVVFYPKTLKGSIALARSYWDGNKIVYDHTFNPSKGSGQNIGIMRWCTSVSSGGNMFLNYHRKLNLHMYYCINKLVVDISKPNRKLCISFSKSNNKVTFYRGNASVNGDNKDITEESAKKMLRGLFDILNDDVSQDYRLEIDMESYYSSISLEQYIIMRNANEESIDDFANEFEYILKYSKDAELIRNHAIKDSNTKIRGRIARDSNSQKELLLFSNDDSKEVRCIVASNQNTPSEVLMDLAKDPSAEVRATVASHKNASIDILESILDNSSDGDSDSYNDILIKCRIVINRNANSDIIERVFNSTHNERVKETIACDRKTNPKILKKLIQDESDYVRRAAINNTSLSREFKERLVYNTDDDLLKINVAQNTDSIEIIKYLSEDPSVLVRLNVAYNENTPADILHKLAFVKSNLKIRRGVVSNPNTSKETFKGLIKFKSMWADLARISDDPKLLRQLASNDNSTSTRYSLADNQNTPVEVLIDLAKDPSAKIRARVCHNQNIPSEVLMDLVKDPSDKVRARVALNKNIPSEVLIDLAKDPSFEVRAQVALNKNTPRDTLQKLINDDSFYVRDMARHTVRSLEEAVLKKYIKLLLK